MWAVLGEDRGLCGRSWERIRAYEGGLGRGSGPMWAALRGTRPESGPFPSGTRPESGPFPSGGRIRQGQGRELNSVNSAGWTGSAWGPGTHLNDVS